MQMGSPVLFVISFVLMIISHSNADMITDVCKDTEQTGFSTYYARCLKYLKGDPKTSSAKDYLELSKFTLELAMKKTLENRNWIKDLLKTKEDPAIKGCVDWYTRIFIWFRSSRSELGYDNLSANYDAKAAGDGADSCQALLDGAGIHNPGITARNNDSSLLSTIAFYVTNRLPQ